MLAMISLIFLLIVIGQLEADMISNSQAIIYGAYGLLMFYHTSKKYWNYKEPKNKGGLTNVKSRNFRKHCRNK